VTTSQSIWAKFLSYLSLYMRHLDFTRGVVALGNVTFFASIVVLAVFLTQRTIDAIRYKRT